MDKLNEFLADPRKVLEWTWNFISTISIVIGIMALVSASKLDDENLKGFGFAAVWSLFLVLFLALLGQHVLGGAARGCIGDATSVHATPMLTGFWLGTCAMLAATFFVLGCVFAAFELEAIQALGAFYIVQFFFLGGYSYYAFKKRQFVYSTSGSAVQQRDPSSLARDNADPLPNPDQTTYTGAE